MNGDSARAGLDIRDNPLIVFLFAGVKPPKQNKFGQRDRWSSGSKIDCAIWIEPGDECVFAPAPLAAR